MYLIFLPLSLSLSSTLIMEINKHCNSPVSPTLQSQHAPCEISACSSGLLFNKYGRQAHLKLAPCFCLFIFNFALFLREPKDLFRKFCPLLLEPFYKSLHSPSFAFQQFFSTNSLYLILRRVLLRGLFTFFAFFRNNEIILPSFHFPFSLSFSFSFFLPSFPLSISFFLSFLPIFSFFHTFCFTFQRVTWKWRRRITIFGKCLLGPFSGNSPSSITAHALPASKVSTFVLNSASGNSLTRIRPPFCSSNSNFGEGLSKKLTPCS